MSAERRLALLDVNVLIALALQDHIHHDAATAWFGELDTREWATTAITESGFVRLCANPRVSSGKISPAAAAAQLRLMVGEGTHRFLIDDTSFALTPRILTGVAGYRQVADAHLLALARTNDGVVTTFDGALRALGGDDVELLTWHS